MTEEHKQQIDEAADKYGFVVPFNGTNNFYNDDKVLGFQSGGNFGYNLAESHYQQLLEAEREKVRRLRDGLNELMIGVDGLPPLTAIAGVLEKQYSNAKQLLTDIPE